jgi:hypothetical protein
MIENFNFIYVKLKVLILLSDMEPAVGEPKSHFLSAPAKTFGSLRLRLLPKVSASYGSGSTTLVPNCTYRPSHQILLQQSWWIHHNLSELSIF